MQTALTLGRPIPDIAGEPLALAALHTLADAWRPIAASYVAPDTRSLIRWEYFPPLPVGTNPLEALRRALDAGQIITATHVAPDRSRTLYARRRAAHGAER